MKAVKIAIGTLIVAVILILSMSLLVKNELADMLNPFISHKDVFVRIDQIGERIDSKTYEYILEGINEDGKKVQIAFTASKHLREGAYLKVDTKRTYVKSWEEVQQKEIPSAVRDKL
ncbi:YxeA family protein [Psychrobacillus sp. NEAU-3TGS]|uniref:YxeA family protein n=1 Tax=Psychrobacillus sp. NEAU-3TGS TaxID=2995412 RepID=UPI002497712C|nr:YxeA family protein [Psychrobacillus sp. NEAU-3TGS]MDI2589178.1 YxeA family protein [Psychrobacillus sp. NEAU-3TGS]